MGGSVSKESEGGQCPHLKANGSTDEPIEQGKEVPEISWNFAWLNLISLKMKGYEFYIDNMKKTGSSVYRANLFTDVVVTCDITGILMLHNTSLTRKVTEFGVAKFDTEILLGQIPCLFTNGDEHLRKKTAILRFMSMYTTEHVLENLANLIPSELHLVEESVSGGNQNIEPLLFQLAANLINTLLLGKTLLHEKMDAWAEAVFTPTFKKEDNTEAIAAYKYLFNNIRNSVSFKEFLEFNKDLNVEEAEFAREIIMMNALNTYHAIKYFLVTVLVLLKRLSPEDLQLIKDDATKLLASPTSADVFKQLINIDGFILEGLRLYPPAANVFRRAKKDFVLQSSSGSFSIAKDQMLLGKLQVAMRDNAVFENAETVDIHRYQNNPKLRQYVVSFGGSFEAEATSENYKCPSYDFALDIIKLMVAHLALYDYTFAEEPVWTGMNPGRLGAADKPIQVPKFVSTRSTSEKD